MPAIFRFPERHRSERGANLVEAAIITPLMILLTFSIVDFGSMFYAYLALENGVSQATRYAVTGATMTGPGGGALSRTDTIKTAMRQATPTLTIPDSAFTFQHMAVGGASWVGGAGGPGEIERVSVTYTWSLLTPVLRPFFRGGQVSFTVDSVMKIESRFS